MYLLEASKIIKDPNVRKIMDQFIKFPTLDRRLYKQTNVDPEMSSLLGYAIEILFDFYIQRNANIILVASRYATQMDEFVEQCEKKQEEKKQSLFLIDSRGRFAWNVTKDRSLAIEYANGYKIMRLSQVQKKYLDSLKIIKKNISLSEPNDEIFDAVCEIAKIYPSLKRFTISPKYLGQSNKALVHEIKNSFYTFLKHFSETPSFAIKEPKVKFHNVHCRPDYIIDDALVEIKCTKELLDKEHIRQVVFYYTALTRQRIIPIKQIARILIFYPRFDYVFEIKIQELISPPEFKSGIKELKAVLEDKLL